MAHAKYAPSGLHRDIACPASKVLSADYPESRSQVAAEGTCAHELSHSVMLTGTPAENYIGNVMAADGFEFTVDADMARYVQDYCDYVTLVAEGGTLLLEQKLPITNLTGETDANGTADAVVIHGNVIHVIDLKFGRGVEVMAEENAQLMAYAFAALDQFRFCGDFETVVLHIVQPRRGHVDIWETTPERIAQFQVEVQQAVARCEAAEADLQEWHFGPSEKACQFCPAKGKCPALAQVVTNIVWDDFVDLTKPLPEPMKREMDAESLGNAMSAIPLIKMWIDAVEAEVSTQINNGVDIPGFKLVQGRQGNRAWGNEGEAACLLVDVLEDEAFEKKLISPTTAEKVLKKQYPDTWVDLQTHITRADGKPTVVPVSDKRPAISADVLTFDVVVN